MKRQLKHILLNNNKKVLTIFIHGFMGNHKDLEHIATNPKITNKTDCLLMDLINHGDSPHTSSFNWNEMTQDVLSLYQDHYSKHYEES